MQEVISRLLPAKIFARKILPTRGKEVEQVMTNVSKKYVFGDMFRERVDDIDMNLPKEIAAMAGCIVWANLKELGYGGRVVRDHRWRADHATAWNRHYEG
jgi:hypothetical protein